MASFIGPAVAFAQRIRMWPLPQIFAVARNFAIHLYRSYGFDNMAQAERYCECGLDTLDRISEIT